MDSKFKKLASDTMIFAIGNVLVKVIQFFLLPLYTSFMTTDQYGTGELINNLSELLYPIFCICIYEALFRLAMDQDVDKKKLFSNGLLVVLIAFPICAIIMAILYFFAGFEFAFQLFVLLLFVSLRTIFAQFARGIGYLKEFAKSGVVNVFSLLVFNAIFLIYFQWGVFAYLISLTLANFVSMIYLFIKCKLSDYLSFSHDLKLLKKMLIYCLPLIPNTFTWWFMNIFDRYVILFACGAELAGIFTAACKLPSIINLCSTVFQQAWQISSTKEINKNDSKDFFSKVFLAYSAFVIIVCSCLITMSQYLAAFLLKGDFYKGWVYLPLLMISAMFNSYSIYFGTTYNAIKKTSNILISTMIGTIINIALIFILIQFMNVYAALIAMAIGSISISIFRMVDTKKYIKTRINIPYHVVAFGIIIIQTVIMTININYCFAISLLLFIALLILDSFIFGKKIFSIIRSVVFHKG